MWIGPHCNRSLEDCVTLWTEEAIENRRHHFYEIPVPEEFWEGGSRPREVTIALAFRPAVRTKRIHYRASFISFKFVRADSLDEVARWFNAQIDRGDAATIPEYDGGRRFSESVRSGGTVQASTWTFKKASQSRRDQSWFVVVTLNDPPWGMLYTAIEARLRARARVRARQ